MGTSRALKSILKDHALKLGALDGVLLPVGAGTDAESQPVLVTAGYSKPQPKPRRHSRSTELLYSRIRGIPLKGVSLKDFCQRCDRMQGAFLVPKYMRDDGCPAKWFDAWQDRNWRPKIHALRQNAWRNHPKKVV